MTYCLSLHKRNVHSDDRPYVCTFEGCNKRFKAQAAYNHHLNTHSEEKKFNCPFCDKSFKTSVQLAGHKNTHTKPYSCAICQRPFSNMYAVKNHMKTHETEKGTTFKHVCGLCGASYARKFALNVHINETHSNETEVEEFVVEEILITDENV